MEMSDSEVNSHASFVVDLHLPQSPVRTLRNKIH